MANEKLQKALYCLDCRGGLEDIGNVIKCRNCFKQYSKIGNSIIFNKPKEFSFEEKNNTDSLVFKIKNQLKKSPKLFRLLHRLIYPVVGKSSKKFVKNLPPDALIINLGSGVMNISSQVIDVDYMPYANVTIVADANQLPFKNESVDAVISEHLLEHLSDPNKVVAEVKRILKPNGLIYILTPFMLGFHSSPNDYYRWTTEGLKELWKDFEPEELGAAIGPTSATMIMVVEWLATIFSFGNKMLHQLLAASLMVGVIPINWLDFIVSRYSFASNNAMALYFIGRKKSN